jgi:hypothetical protein
VRLLRDSAQGFLDVFRIRYHFTRRRYVNGDLQRIVRADAGTSLTPHRLTFNVPGGRSTP